MGTKETEKPPEDEESPLLNDDGQGAIDWRTNSYTRKVCVGQTKRYVAFMKELARMGLGSTDPKIAAKAMQIQEIATMIIVMGGKV